MRAAFLLLLAIAGTVGCADLVSECRELVVGDTYLVGSVNRLTGDAKYVRAFYASAAQQRGAPPLGYVRVGAHRATLVGATPSSLAAAGVPETTTVADRRIGARTFGVNCRRETVEAFLEVRFVGDVLHGVGATQFAPGECDFAVGWREERAFSLPASSQTINAALPSPASFRECRPVW